MTQMAPVMTTVKTGVISGATSVKTGIVSVGETVVTKIKEVVKVEKEIDLDGEVICREIVMEMFRKAITLKE